MPTKNTQTTQTSEPVHPKPSLKKPSHTRCGKVARLPKAVRDQLNQMLLDGVPYAQIIQKLSQPTAAPDSSASHQSNVLPLDSTGARPTTHSPAPTAPEPASPITHDASLLTPTNISNWKKFGGYRDWLKDQQRLDECRLRHELTLDLATQTTGPSVYQAAPKIAIAQICELLIDLGREGLQDALAEDRRNYFRLLNVFARLIASGFKCERQISEDGPLEQDQPEKNGLSPDAIGKMHTALNLI